jgi:hypothetical protein
MEFSDRLLLQLVMGLKREWKYINKGNWGQLRAIEGKKGKDKKKKG